MDDRYTIDTPENIEFAYDIAGIGSRFLAAIIDTLTRYNRAESEAAALLTLEPLRPFIEPNGAFAQRGRRGCA